MNIGVDFAEDAKLNKLKLADEAESLSSMLAFYGEQMAEAKAARDKAARALELQCAQTELDIRRNPPKDLDKLTESIVKALVTSHPDVVKCEQALLDAKEKAYTMEVAWNTIDSKGSMIKVLQALWGTGYYSA